MLKYHGGALELIVLALGAIISVTANGQAYRLTDLGTLGGTSSYSRGINSTGQVVGYSTDSSGGQHAFVSSGTTMASLGDKPIYGFGINDSGQVAGVLALDTFTRHAFVSDGTTLKDLGTLGGPSSAAWGINSGGVVVGTADIAPNVSHAFLWSAGSMTDLGTLGGSTSIAYAINASGQVVGASQVTGDTAYRAFITSGAALQDLGTLGGTTSYAFGVNAAGQVTGYAYDASGHYWAFVSDGTSMTNLGAFGGPVSVGYAINDFGQVVGSADIPGGWPRAFLYTDGKLIDLNTMIATDPLAAYVTLSEAHGINNDGWIASDGVDSRTGNTHAYLLTPLAPVVAFSVAGTQGTNGWYKSNVTVSWNITSGAKITSSTGCSVATISADTMGTTLTCGATNSAGTSNASVTIKRDATAPVVKIKAPANGARYKLNSAVKASYSCADATSGLLSCVGTVPNGSRVSTAAKGGFEFAVTATDNAGNTTTSKVTYTVR